MKKLLLIRHAKSSWDDPSQKDIDRPLNDRGQRDALAMAKRLLDKKIDIDAFLTSPAKRAYATCKYFTEAYKVKEKKIISNPRLYEPSPDDFFHVVAGIDDDAEIAAVISHNPGITAFINELTETHIDDMPTCGIFAIKADTKKWKHFSEAEKSFWFFDAPKRKD